MSSLHYMAAAINEAPKKYLANAITQDMSDYLPVVKLTRIFQNDGYVWGVMFSKDETGILTWSEDHTARLWDVPGDMDFPKDKCFLMIEALTGTEFDPLTYQIKTIPKAE